MAGPSPAVREARAMPGPWDSALPSLNVGEPWGWAQAVVLGLYLPCWEAMEGSRRFWNDKQVVPRVPTCLVSNCPGLS